MACGDISLYAELLMPDAFFLPHCRARQGRKVLYDTPEYVVDLISRTKRIEMCCCQLQVEYSSTIDFPLLENAPVNDFMYEHTL